MEISLNTRAETAKLFLDTIRPLKSCYSPGHAFLHIGDSGVHYGEKAARMEGFARVLWGLGPLWAGGTKDFTAEMIQVAEVIFRWHLAWNRSRSRRVLGRYL